MQDRREHSHLDVHGEGIVKALRLLTKCSKRQRDTDIEGGRTNHND